MARLNWGVVAERFFETGVDRGVLYTGDGNGVPWNGLTSVSESPTGGEPKPAYIDGRKFRNIASSEEFEATIEAFAAPKEFGPCDGSRSIQNGLIATQQPRQAFSFSYRTLIGNPVEGTELGYKIHLVYNALAGPASRSNASIGDSTEASKLSWAVTTLPPSLTGYKPTAHFVIDSTQTPLSLLMAIEDILYGNDVNSARMPLVSELVAMFQSEGPVMRRNLATVRKPVPVSANSTTTEGVIFDSDTWTQVDTILANHGVRLSLNDLTSDIPNGETMIASWEVANPSTTDQVNLQYDWADLGTTVTLEPLERRRIYASGMLADYGTTYRFSDVTSTTANQSFLFREVLVEKGSTELPYFDGSTVDQDGYFYSWEGDVNASVSRLNTWN